MGAVLSVFQQSKEEEERQKRREINEDLSEKRTILLRKRPGQTIDVGEGIDFPDCLYVSLFGDVAVGKSSLINSLLYSFFGGLPFSKRQQASPKSYEGTHTRSRREVHLTKHICVVDNRAILTEDLSNNAVLDEVIRHLNGNYQVGQVDWKSPGPRLESDKKSYCTILVFSANNERAVREYRGLVNRVVEWQGQYPLAVVTHADEASSGKVRQELQKIGISKDCIFDIANVTYERPELEERYQKSMLRLLEKCCLHGDQNITYRSEEERGHLEE